MILSREYINKHKTPAGAWTKQQLIAIGIGWPAPKGWIKRSIGKEITEDNANKFEAKVTARQVKVGKMTPEGLADSLLSNRIELSDKKLAILIVKLQEEQQYRMDNPRGGNCRESTHKVTTLKCAQEWYAKAKESDLPMTVLQWTTPNGRTMAIFSDYNGQIIGEKG